MCTMTASSIGYGDLSPQNAVGRGFFVFWMIAGYVVVATAIRDMSAIYLRLRERRVEEVILNRDIGKEILALDADGDGMVDRFEYLSHMAVVMGKMKRYEIDEIMARFNALDKTGDGKLSADDFEELSRTAKSPPTGAG